MKNRCSNAVGEAIPACRQAGAGHPSTKGFPNLGGPRGAPLHYFFKNHSWIPVFTGMKTWLNQQENLFKQLKGLSFLRKQSLPRTGCGESRSCSLVLKDSKGISVIFLVIAMLLMVVIGYVFSYLIPTKQRSVVFPIQSTQAFFLAQSGVEFAVRYAKDSGWTTKAALNNLNNAGNNARTLGSGRFTLTYDASSNDTLTSIGEVPTGTQRRQINVSHFSSFLYYFAYHKLITVNTGAVNGTLTNFPMLVSMTDPNLQALPNGAANGGHIAAYNGTTNDPYDLVFEALDDTTCGGANTSPCKLNHEIEAYGASNGRLVAWVRVPSITNGTMIYMYYGNSCMTASAQNATAVWDANYKGVWHLSQSPTGTAPQMKDSTADAYNGTAVGAFVAGDQQAAVINGGLNFDSGTNDEIQISAANVGTTSVTVSAWIRVKSWSETTFSAGSGNLGAVAFSTRDVDCDVSPTLVVSPASGGAGAQNGLVFCNDTAGVAMGAKGATAIAPNTWYYAVGTFSYTGTGNFAGNWNVYLNGIQNNAAVNNFNFAGAANAIFSGAIWRLANNAQWPLFSNVILDEVRVSNIARSAGWINTEYRNQNAPGTFYTVGAEQNN